MSYNEKEHNKEYYLKNKDRILPKLRAKYKNKPSKQTLINQITELEKENKQLREIIATSN